MKEFLTLALLTILLAFCKSKSTISVTENHNDIPKQLRLATLNYLDTIFDEGSKIDIEFNPTLDSGLFTKLNNWVKYNKKKLGDEDLEILSKLPFLNFDNKYLNSGDTSFLKGQKAESIVDIKFRGLAFNNDTTRIATVLSVLFGELQNSGWEELIVYLKVGKHWTISKREVILEY